MNIGYWFESHPDVGFTISHPETKAGHKTDIEMWNIETGKNVFRESVTYKELSDEAVVELLEDMYKQLH